MAKKSNASQDDYGRRNAHSSKNLRGIQKLGRALAKHTTMPSIEELRPVASSSRQIPRFTYVKNTSKVKEALDQIQESVPD